MHRAIRRYFLGAAEGWARHSMAIGVRFQNGKWIMGNPPSSSVAAGEGLRSAAGLEGDSARALGRCAAVRLAPAT